MDCRESQTMVTPYIEDQLDEEQLEAFLKHIKTCPECWEELSIYFIVDVGLKQLEGEQENYNIKEALEETLLLSEQRVKNKYSILITKYVAMTLATLSIIIIILLQFRIWLQNGIR